jgi:hypothetical protein
LENLASLSKTVSLRIRRWKKLGTVHVCDAKQGFSVLRAGRSQRHDIRSWISSVWVSRGGEGKCGRGFVPLHIFEFLSNLRSKDIWCEAEMMTLQSLLELKLTH